MKDQTMKTDHTPGPWTIQHGHSNRVYLIDNAQGHALGEIVYSDTRNPADAQLIAAAPDMLDALQSIPPCNHTEPHMLACFKCKARAAVYKAIGA